VAAALVGSAVLFPETSIPATVDLALQADFVLELVLFPNCVAIPLTLVPFGCGVVIFTEAAAVAIEDGLTMTLSAVDVAGNKEERDEVTEAWSADEVDETKAWIDETKFAAFGRDELASEAAVV
jgi:hypothetical protein